MHMDSSSAFQSEMRQMINNLTVASTQNSSKAQELEKKVLDHDDTIKHLDRAHNRQKGAMWAVGLSGGVGFFHAVKTFLGL